MNEKIAKTIEGLDEDTKGRARAFWERIYECGLMIPNALTAATSANIADNALTQWLERWAANNP